MSEVPAGEDKDDEDLTAPPHGDAGEPPTAKSTGMFGGMAVDKMDPLLAIAIGQFDFKRLFTLDMAVRLIESKENVPASETTKLAASFHTYLENDNLKGEKPPVLKAVDGGKK